MTFTGNETWWPAELQGGGSLHMSECLKERVSLSKRGSRCSHLLWRNIVMYLKYSIQIRSSSRSPHRERGLWYSLCRKANGDTEKPLVSYDITACQMLNKIGSASQALSKLKEAAGPPCAFHHLTNRDLSSRNVRARWDTRLPLRAKLVPLTMTVSLLFTPTSSVPARSWTLWASWHKFA